MTTQTNRSFWAAALLIAGLAAAVPSTGAAAVPPAGVVVSSSGTDALIAWNAAKGATGYEVMRTADPAQAPAKIATLSSTSLGYRDKQIAAGTTYYYQIVSVAADGTRAASGLYKFVSAAAGGATGTMPAAPGGATPAAAAVSAVTPASVGATTPATGPAASAPPPAGAPNVNDPTFGHRVDAMYVHFEHVGGTLNLPFPGESATQPGKSELIRFEYDPPEFSVPGGSQLAAGTGSTAGQTVRLTKYVGAANAAVARAWVAHEVLGRVTVELMSSSGGGPVLMRKYVLTNAVIFKLKRYAALNPAPGDEIEEISLRFNALEIDDGSGQQIAVLK